MIDAEVLRLRSLRYLALRVRAIAEVLGADQSAITSMYSASAVTCWSISRLITGHLRAHPYLSYQQGPNALRAGFVGAVSALNGRVARYRDRAGTLFAAQLQELARELDDARRLTRSALLSDSLGRLQLQIQGLIEQATVASGFAGVGEETPSGVEETAAEWPYLAIQRRAGGMIASSV